MRKMYLWTKATDNGKGAQTGISVGKESLEMYNFSTAIAMKAMQEGRDEGCAEGRENYASDLHVLRMYLKSIGKYDDAERAADKPECFAELWEKHKDKI